MEDIERRNFDGEIDHLLILANSAEIMLESEDKFSGMQIDERLSGNSSVGWSQVELCNATAITDCKEPKKQVHEFHALAHAIYENCKFWSGKVTRLSEIRRLARNTNKHFVLEESGKFVNGCSRGRSVRLTGVRCQARRKGQLQGEERITTFEDEHPEGRVIRMSQIRRQARSKSNSIDFILT